MGALKIIINIILIIILVNLLIVAGIFVYENYPRAAKELKAHYSGVEDLSNYPNISNKAVQFYPNMRFSHNKLSYFVIDCSDEKIARLENAFSIITELTGNLFFYETAYEEKADIDVGCSAADLEKNENVFVAGEGGPSKFINSSLYPTILKGKIILYKESSCEMPITELHEIFHVLGFDHVNDSKKIMYPYVNCKQEIDTEMIEMLRNLYSIHPKAELYFSNASIIKSGIYLNFSVIVSNDGLSDAKNVSLEVYQDNNRIDSFDLKNIEFGTAKSFLVGNMRLKSVASDKISLKIITESEEYYKDNNIIEAKAN